MNYPLAASPLTPLSEEEQIDLLVPFFDGEDDDAPERAVRQRTRDEEKRLAALPPEDRDAELDEWFENYFAAEAEDEARQVAERDDDDDDLLALLTEETEAPPAEQAPRDGPLASRAAFAVLRRDLDGADVQDALDAERDAQGDMLQVYDRMQALLGEVRAAFPSIGSHADLARLDPQAAEMWGRCNEAFEGLKHELVVTGQNYRAAQLASYEALAAVNDAAFAAANPRLPKGFHAEVMGVLADAGISADMAAAMWAGGGMISARAPESQAIILEAASYRLGRPLKDDDAGADGMIEYLKGILGGDEDEFNAIVSGKPYPFRAYVTQQIVADAARSRLKAKKKGKRK